MKYAFSILRGTLIGVVNMKEWFIELSPITILSLGKDLGVNSNKCLMNPNDKGSFNFELYREYVWKALCEKFEQLKKL